jgi:serine/threonine protein kinase
MKAADAVHPSPENLQAFGQGKLDNFSNEPVRRHLENCPECRRYVADLPGDSFLGQFQGAKSADATIPPERSPSPPANTIQGKRPAASSLPLELQNNSQFDVRRELGRGGMGVVFLADNKMMGHPEVLKVISKSFITNPSAVERFLREIQMAARLNHENVVRAYGAMQLGDLLVLVMEYVEGQDLQTLVQKEGPLPIANACFYTRQVALGLQHAHEREMVHRDIKPRNLILVRHGKKHTVKILDFGLAKATSEKGMDADLTGDGKMLGTPSYMAPEQMRDAAKVDIRADIYSLGCTLYYLLTGSPPFKASNYFKLVQAHQSAEITPLNLVRADVSAELAAVARKMTAKDPGERFQKPSEVAQALLPFVKLVAKGLSAGSAPMPALEEKDHELNEINEQIPTAEGGLPVPFLAAPVYADHSTGSVPEVGNAAVWPEYIDPELRIGDAETDDAFELASASDPTIPTETSMAAIAGGRRMALWISCGALLCIVLVAIGFALIQRAALLGTGAQKDEPVITQSPRDYYSPPAPTREMKPEFVASDAFFNGNNLDGWEGLTEFWSGKGGAIVGATPTSLKFDTFLCGKRIYKDFALRFEVRLKDGGGASGVQIRNKILTPQTFAVAGPQGVMAEGFWGSFYGELFGNGGKGDMMKAAPKAKVASAMTKKGEFVDYYIKCVGKHVTIRLNGLTTVEDDFPNMPAEGIIALQLYRGVPMEVTFRNIQFKDLSSEQ